MIRINLLQHETSKGRGFSLNLSAAKVAPVALMALILVACAGAAITQKGRLANIERDVASVRAEAEQYKRTIAMIDEMTSQEQNLRRRLRLVEQLDEERYNTVRVLDEVARRVPRYMWLTSLKNVGPQKYAIDGYAFSNLVVSDLMFSLDKSGVFQDIKLSVAQRKVVEGQNTVNFTVTSTIDPAGLGES